MIVKENIWRDGRVQDVVWAAVGLVVIVVVVMVTSHFNGVLPTPRPASAPLRQFSGHRAHRHVAALTALGPRPAGSPAADLHAPRLLVDAVKTAARRAAPHHRLEVDAWTADGNLTLEFLDGMTSVYRGVRGVAVRVSGAGEPPGEALLANCHYDTVEGSPGAGDDAAACGVLLELLDVLLAAPTPFRHTLVMLFNGAEEDIMLASHAFITQHKWARQVRGIVNLDACGAGGREMLFQSGPHDHWLTDLYASEVPYPCASTLGHDVFSSGVIPADTDYRIFTQFGNLSGLNFAWVANGYVYHTALDTADVIPPAALQHTGDNLVALFHAALSAPKLGGRPGVPSAFLDIAGICMITVGPGLVGVSILLSIAQLALSRREARQKEGARGWRWIRRVGRAGGRLVVAGAAGLVVAVGGALVVHVVGPGRMFWYGREGVVALYGVGAVLGAGAVVAGGADWWAAGGADRRAVGDAVLAWWLITAGVLAALGVRSAVVAVLWAGCISAGGLMATLVGGAGRVLGTIPALLIWWSAGLGLEEVLLPVLGRGGVNVPADVVAALLTAVVTLGSVWWLAPLICGVRRIRTWCVAAGVVWALLVVVVALGALGSPYTAQFPQRIMCFHLRTTSYSSKNATVRSEFWIPELDANTANTVNKYLPGSVSAECDVDAVWCGWPYPLPARSLVSSAVSAPAPPPPTTFAPSVERNGNTITSRGNGTARVVILLSPLNPKAYLTRTDGELIEAKAGWQGRRAYFVSVVDLVAPHAWEVALVVGGAGGAVQVTVAGHTGGGTGVSELFPSWTTHSNYIVDQHHYTL